LLLIFFKQPLKNMPVRKDIRELKSIAKPTVNVEYSPKALSVENSMATP
jgi:methylglyoxal synthase